MNNKIMNECQNQTKDEYSIDSYWKLLGCGISIDFLVDWLMARGEYVTLLNNLDELLEAGASIDIHDLMGGLIEIDRVDLAAENLDKLIRIGIDMVDATVLFNMLLKDGKHDVAMDNLEKFEAAGVYADRLISRDEKID